MSDAAAGDIPDPFAPQTHVPHSALSRNTLHGSGYDPTLFDEFFASPAFGAWSSGSRSWQLHCYGEPGCGKTTVAAFAANRLPSGINGTKTAVASVSITQYVWSTSLAFIEDLFQFIYSEFGNEPNAEYGAYQRACRSGDPVTERIGKLVGALKSFASGACKFLILDGYDRINEALQSIVDTHLSALEPSGFKVMITRRVPAFSMSINTYCDECEQEYLELWWKCSHCNEFDLCYDCEKKKSLKEPHICPVNGLKEPYQHVSIKLGHFNMERLLEERLSVHYRDIHSENTIRIVDYIESKAGGNITLALLYLEDIFIRDQIATFSKDRVDDRLPRDVIAYFDTEMSFIERKMEPERLPPLYAIGAAADHAHGISLEELEQCIRLAQITCSSLDYPRSVEDVFTAANGWLTDLRTGDRKVDICCKPAFSLYVKEKYNDSLERARHHVKSTAGERSGATPLHQFQETSSSDKTPDLLGSTFDTLASDRPPPTPLMSLEDGLRIRELEGTFGQASFLDKGEGLVQSPPRINSAEYVPQAFQGISPRHKPEGKATQPKPDLAQSPVRLKSLHDQRSKLSFLPTRLLDVDTGDDNIIRLVDTKTTKVKGPYCTLSHAWGPREKPFLTTTVWNMAKHLLTGITMNELPRNFQHAIHVTRFLKVRYIWIDSLAIVQAPFGDFAKEADLMHKVYRYSHCNIVAADSKDAHGGLFKTRNPHEILPVTYQGTNARHHLGKKSWTIVPADLWEQELLSSAIYSRAWVFQERILSPRILHFTKQQIFWDCGTLSACEVFPKGLPFPLDHKASTDRHWRGRLAKSTVSSNALIGVNDNESSYTFWMSAVQNYTECDLTNQCDKTIAIWSIAKLLRDFMNEQYAVGMWSDALEEQLAWRVRDTKSCKRIPELDVNIPSWSWASLQGAVVPQHRLAIRAYKVTDHAGAIINFAVKEETRQGDKEPVLESKTLALKTHINIGRLVEVQEDQYRLQFSSETSCDIIELDVFLDTPLATTRIDRDHCAFIILAASAPPNTTDTPHSPQSSSLQARQTYSGVGLLLIPRRTWFADQERLYRDYKSALAGAEPSREQQWRLDAFEKLVLQPPERVMKMEGNIGSVYRRMGALQFRDMDERAFNEMTDARHREDIWLE
ncbi:hypothetical protein J4E83_009788 [Alternaria metachromatica]|uniref:uncharacterized protein n=1 Tax=Alternaria metachromatica TaxID=283354 RepID=UPI0020C34AB8|nr:uncharacterized protein J4E83_009788 [Alternaria metachromatica]KAI4607033.1 hypothetical protein J4E83_009788 [Alternaria metachromatica]